MKALLMAFLSLVLSAAVYAAGTDPCAWVTEAEVGSALGVSAVRHSKPHRVTVNGVSVGGDCFYASKHADRSRVAISVDQYPGRNRRAFFERQRHRPNMVDVNGVGDGAYAFVSPLGFVQLTFLKGDTLVTVSLQTKGQRDALSVAKIIAGIAAKSL
jgi:hypothetical protein